jgi:hypothetical protein
LRILSQSADRVRQRRRVSWRKEEPGSLVFEHLGGTAHIRGRDRHTVQDPLQNNHSKGLIPTRDDEDVCGAEYTTPFRTASATREVDFVAIREQDVDEPGPFDFRTTAVAAGEDKPRPRHPVQHQRDGLQQFTNAFSIHETTAV